MPTIQSAFMRGNARLAQAHAVRHGAATVVDFVHTFPEAVNTTDVLELCILPANMKINQLIINTEGITTTNLTVGYMTGVPFDTNPARTVGSEIFNAVAAGTEIAATRVNLGAAANAPTAEHRSIGMRPSANIAAGGGRRLHFFMLYSG